MVTDDKTLRKEWGADAHKHLAGKKIAEVRYMTDDEIEWFGWDRAAVVIVLDSGEMLSPMRDDEGNGPGALFTSLPGKLGTIPVI